MKTLLVLALGISIAACGGSVVIPAGGSGSASGTGGASGATTTATASSTGGLTSGSGNGVGPTTVGIGSSGVGGGAPVCGGFAGKQCASGEYCAFPSQDCGGDDDEGICAPKPEGCGQPPAMPVCGCDGKIYPSACLAEIQGVSVNTVSGSCGVASVFACGNAFCTSGTQYCLQDIDTNGVVCATLPPACQSSNATCDCVTKNLDCSTCMGSTGQLTATCGEG